MKTTLALMLVSLSATAQPPMPPKPPQQPEAVVMAYVAQQVERDVYDPKAQLARNRAIAPSSKFPVLPLAFASPLISEVMASIGGLVTCEIGASPSTNVTAYYVYFWQPSVPATVTHSVPATIGPTNITATIVLPGPGRWFFGATAFAEVESAMLIHSNRWPLAYEGKLTSFGKSSFTDQWTPFLTNRVELDKRVDFLWQSLEQVVIP